MSIAAGTALTAADDKGRFVVRPAADYPHKQTSEKVTIAAQPYQSDEEAAAAFGKLNPYRMGILPVLIVIQNDSPDAIRVDKIKFYYVLPDNSQVESTPAQDLRYLRGVKAPQPVNKPLGGIVPRRAPKNPLAEWEVEGRAFAAKMIPAGQSASGFVYFRTNLSSAAASVSISGLTNPVTGKELYYFEIPMSGK